MKALAAYVLILGAVQDLLTAIFDFSILCLLSVAAEGNQG